MHVQTAAIISCENVEAAGLRFAVSLGKELEMMTGLIYSCYFCVCLFKATFLKKFKFLLSHLLPNLLQF